MFSGCFQDFFMIFTGCSPDVLMIFLGYSAGSGGSSGSYGALDLLGHLRHRLLLLRAIARLRHLTLLAAPKVVWAYFSLLE